jgi:hypothetical protein
LTVLVVETARLERRGVNDNTYAGKSHLKLPQMSKNTGVERIYNN